jgi:hypothetical protein
MDEGRETKSWSVWVCHDQWGRRLEGWANTSARLAGLRREIWQLWFCAWWTDRTPCLFSTVPVAQKRAAQLRADGISSCCFIVNVHNHPSWATSCKEDMAWCSSRPMHAFSLVRTDAVRTVQCTLFTNLAHCRYLTSFLLSCKLFRLELSSLFLGRGWRWGGGG